MAATANGWRVLTAAECVTIAVPGGELPVHPKFAGIFADLAHRWHDRVEPLQWPGCWGWAPPRPIRGGTVTSNHCSGTAVDFSAPSHPRGVPVHITFTARELQEIAALEQRYAGVLRWGGRWTGQDVDGMHWEGVPGVTVEAVDALTARLQAPPPRPPVPAPAPPAPPAPVPAPAGPGWTGPDLRGSAFALRGEQGANGMRVLTLQNFLRVKYPLYAKHLAADGWWGEDTTAKLREFARRSGVRTADGRNIGPQIARKLYLAGFRG